MKRVRKFMLVIVMEKYQQLFYQYSQLMECFNHQLVH